MKEISSSKSFPSPEKIKLVIAGGYDTRVTENVEHHKVTMIL